MRMEQDGPKAGIVFEVMRSAIQLMQDSNYKQNVQIQRRLFFDGHRQCINNPWVLILIIYPHKFIVPCSPNAFYHRVWRIETIVN